MNYGNQPPFNQPGAPQPGAGAPMGYGQQPQQYIPPQTYQYPLAGAQPPIGGPNRGGLSTNAIIGIVAGSVLAVLVCCGVGIIFAIHAGSDSAGNQSTPAKTTVPTETVAQYQSSAQSVTVSDLAKSPSAYKGKTVTFTAVIVSFIPNQNGDDTAANVIDPSDDTTLIAVQFSPGLSVQHVNTGDTITVWGQGEGALSGTNAFGATIQESAVQEVYLDDTTSGYKDTSVKDPARFVSSLSN